MSPCLRAISKRDVVASYPDNSALFVSNDACAKHLLFVCLCRPYDLLKISRRFSFANVIGWPFYSDVEARGRDHF